jgi:hypothetical protein
VTISKVLLFLTDCNIYFHTLNAISYSFFPVLANALIFLPDNRGRFVPRESRGDEGRNRFGESRRDNTDRDYREPKKWEHDMSTHPLHITPIIACQIFLFAEVRVPPVRAAPSAEGGPRFQHKQPSAVDRRTKCPCLVRTFYSR